MRENHPKPILTISILSSNRRDTIRKCLDSIDTLRERVPSELIIVDTSQNEEMREILSEYTDKIIPFTWCNDFSKARNVGVDAAKGKWFLYLDDDEWFIDTKEIEEFFLSGAYKKYVLAYYKQRNYGDKAGTIYEDARVSRVFPLKNKIRFVSSIHEYPDPLPPGKAKFLQSVVEHYGYAYDTEEQKLNHARRNIPLLEDMIKKERKNPRWWLQLVQEYRTIGQYPELQKCCEKALQVFDGINNDADVIIAKGTFYNGIITKHLKFYEYAEAEAMLRRALQDKFKTKMCTVALYVSAANLYFYSKEHKDHAKCEEYCRKYMESFEEMKDNEEERYALGYFFVDEAFNQNNLEQMYCLYIICALEHDDPDILKKYFWNLSWDGKILFVEATFIERVIDGFARLPYDEEFVKMAEKMMERPEVDDAVVSYVKKREKGDAQEFARLEKIFLQMKGHQPYFLYLKVKNMSDGQELERLMEGIDFYEWRLTVDEMFGIGIKEALEKVSELLSGLEEKYGSRRDYFFMKQAETGLWAQGMYDYALLRQAIENFVEKNYIFYRRFFTEYAFTGEMEMLPVQGRIAVKMGQVLGAEKTGDVKAVKAALKSCLDVYPAYNQLIKAYTKLYAEEVKKRLAEEKRSQQVEDLMVSAEMNQLGRRIKKKIRFLLEQGMAEEAGQVLEQLKQITPGDEELEELEEAVKGTIS